MISYTSAMMSGLLSPASKLIQSWKWTQIEFSSIDFFIFKRIHHLAVFTRELYISPILLSSLFTGRQAISGRFSQQNLNMTFLDVSPKFAAVKTWRNLLGYLFCLVSNVLIFERNTYQVLLHNLLLVIYNIYNCRLYRNKCP